jgi:hypothetical protein
VLIDLAGQLENDIHHAIALVASIQSQRDLIEVSTYCLELSI